MQKQLIRREAVKDDFLAADLHPVIKQLYAARGVKSDDELQLKVAQLQDVMQLKGIEQGCEVLFKALQAQQKIIIVGDFDADGATSTALMIEALQAFGANSLDFIVPNRFEFGYGLSPEIVQVAAEQGAQLLITVDNGISCVAGVEMAKSLGLSVIVTDHHLPGDSLPMADAIINPNQKGCPFPSKSLAGVGVAFYFMLAFRKYLREQDWFLHQQITEPNIAKLLDLVALGTVADVVSLDANNRILVEQGLLRIRAGQTRPGIQALIEVAGKNQQRLSASDFGFALGPRINAAGRLDDMSFGINCLLAKEPTQAKAMALELDSLNKSRREIEQGMQLEAETIFKGLNLGEQIPFAIALYHPQWHQGVIGIVAGRLKEKFHRPSIVFAADNKSGSLEIKGSARSIPGLHIRDLLEHINTKHPGMILKFGGHAMAAGLTIKLADFEAFAQIFASAAEAWIAPEDLKGVILSDGELELSDMQLNFAHLLKSSGPWGQNFNEPIFDDTFEVIQQKIVGKNHLKTVLQKQGQLFDAIAFNIDIKEWPNSAAKFVRVAYKLDINEFRGKQTLQLMVESIICV